MALDGRRLGQQVGVELEQVIGGHQPGDDGGRARAEAPRQRYLRADREGEVVGRVQALERAHDEVVAAPRDGQVGLDGEAAGLGDLELEPGRHRRRHAIEAGPEVR